MAVLEHIAKRGHDKELAKAFSVAESNVIKFLCDVARNGGVVSNRIRKVGNRDGFESVYDYGGRYVALTAIGLNGFLVSAFPSRERNDARAVGAPAQVHGRSQRRSFVVDGRESERIRALQRRRSLLPVPTADMMRKIMILRASSNWVEIPALRRWKRPHPRGFRPSCPQSTSSERLSGMS